MKRLYEFITSLPFMAFLFLALAFVMAVATFIESAYGTPAARSLVYNTHWFEVLWGLFALNLVNNLLKYRFFSTHRITLGLFHIAFVVMILGAAVTRFFSYEGMMHIREGQSSSFIVSTEDEFYAAFGNDKKKDKVRFSEITPRQFSATLEANGKRLDVKAVGFIKDAESQAVEVANGEPVIDFVYSTPMQQGMQSHAFRLGEELSLPGFSVGFGVDRTLDVNFFMQDGQLTMVSRVPIQETTMASQETKELAVGDTLPARSMFLYGVGQYRFLIRKFLPNATFTAVKSRMQSAQDAVMVRLSSGDETRIVPVFGRSGTPADTVRLTIAGESVKLAYGAPLIQLPFSLFLKDFQLEKYPGSQSPASYASEVVLKDPEKGLEKEVRIFMNNTLMHRGYKFFQSSYDMDEQGTILSVNYDFLGTWISYIGYILMGIGFITSMVNKNSYFQYLIRRLKENVVHVLLLAALLTGGVLQANSQGISEDAIPDISDELVEEFSRLWVQGADGRIEPVSTLSSEIVRKVSRKSSLYGKSPDEVVLSMMTYPQLWSNLPIIKVSNSTLAETLGATNKYITLSSLFDAQGNYKISERVRAAYTKNPAFRNRVEKEYIYVDERVNICYMVMQGAIFHIFPRPNSEDTWYSPGAEAVDYTDGDSIFIRSGFQLLQQSIASNSVSDALQVLQAVANFQTKYGGQLLPGETKKNMEILFNKVNSFKKVFPFYLFFGFLLLLVLFVNIFRQKALHPIFRQGFMGVIIILFLVHTGGLILRWYISGHAPWSNGYESMVYVAWAAMLAGIIFGRKYPMVVGTAAFLSGIALFVAHLSWMNPEITPLVPVLKSYWLAIHVSVITASYGFIGLSMFLGILVMILMVIRNPRNTQKVEGFIEQLTTINEMSATVGLYFLTIGTFLGGVWANESWGRYWGWDPKETWSLITIMIYSFVVHMRLIPALKGTFSYNFATIVAFASVLMTYLGVNYYLTGLHSYGKGVADGVHPVMFMIILLLAVLIVMAYRKEKLFRKNQSE